MKIVFNDIKTGQSFQKEVEAGKQAQLLGKKIGDAIEGGLIGLDGFKLKLTGGSNKDGVPMRSDIKGQRRTKAVVTHGVGAPHLKKGQRALKIYSGNTISQDSMQLNTAISEYGTKALSELGFTPKAKTGEKKEEQEKK